MQIVKIEAGHYRIPLPTPLSDSAHGEMPDFELIVARVSNEEGVEGVGYTYTVGRGGGAIRWLIEQELAPLLLGSDPRRTEELWDRMWQRLHWVGRGGVVAFAMSAVDIALWDLQARAAGKPLWHLLASQAGRVQAYAGGVDLQFSLTMLRGQTRKFLSQGFRAIKMKVGRDQLSEDLERVAAVRDCLGPEMPLMVDANMRWSVEEAIRASQALAEFNVYWLEEPTSPDDFEGHARIAQRGRLPIAAGENLHTVAEFRLLMAQGGVSFPEPDVSNMGGITAWMRVACLARERGLPVTSHGVHDIHVHLLAAVPNASFMEVHGFGLERFMQEPLRFENGDAVVPERPGHGVDFRWERLEAYRVPQVTLAVGVTPTRGENKASSQKRKLSLRRAE
jgi:L-alanine-DL-glutamate epimerase-like enolase superfamily enzyme